MKLSELEKHLKALREEHGDIEVAVDDADTGWLLKISDVDLSVILDDGPHRLEIGPDYQSERLDVPD